MDRYHTDPFFQSIIDRARAERDAHLQATLASGAHRVAAAILRVLRRSGRRLAQSALPFTSAASR